MLDHTDYLRWQATADVNLDSARRETGAGAHHVAVFLAEQAAQCALKGLLHGIGATSRARGHGLIGLGEAISAETGEPFDAPVRAGLQRLAQAYMPSRYPDALPEGTPADHYGASDADRAIEDAAAALAHVREIWTRLEQAERSDRSARGSEGSTGGGEAPGGGSGDAR